MWWCAFMQWKLFRASRGVYSHLFSRVWGVAEIGNSQGSYTSLSFHKSLIFPARTNCQNWYIHKACPEWPGYTWKACIRLADGAPFPWGVLQVWVAVKRQSPHVIMKCSCYGFCSLRCGLLPTLPTPSLSSWPGLDTCTCPPPAQNPHRVS